MKRRIKKADVQFLSLCRRGMNQMPCLFKSDAGDSGVGTIELSCLHKYDEAKGELLFVAYAPELRDGEGDIADAAVIKEMAYSHARNGARLDVRHNLKPLEPKDAFMAESFII
ncbi:MAG: XkdF-like putative serine protease domain-containing protein, partial [Chloroflexota bacterium]